MRMRGFFFHVLLLLLTCTGNGLLAAEDAPPKDDQATLYLGDPQRFSRSDFPENFRPIFDLPWCRTWELSCMTCESVGADVFCHFRRDRKECQETFRYHRCIIFNLPRGCIKWTDACNIWLINQWGGQSTTLTTCPSYYVPYLPSFKCLKFKDSDP